MADELRHALAVNLQRSGDALEDLARRASGPEAASRVEAMEESQAYADAGAAIWEAVTRGLLNVPKVAAVIGGRVSNGCRKVGNGSQCANIFFETMGKFLYSLGTGVFPYFGFQRKTHEARTIGAEDAAALQALWRRHELQERATGCHLLAKLIESGSDGQYRSEAERVDLLGQLADSLRRYTTHINEECATGGEAETDIIILAHQLRCYYGGRFAEEFASLWDQFLLATTPYEESTGLALTTANDMLCWVEREQDRSDDKNGDGEQPTGVATQTVAIGAKPFWDGNARRLWLDGKMIKQYTARARNQMLILATFEELGWTERVDSPFASNEFQRLHDTIGDLNQSIPELRFRADDGIWWERGD